MHFYTAALILYFLCFTTIATLRFRLALGLFFFLLPTYLIRFDIGPLPTTMLEVMFGILIIVWLVRGSFVIPTGANSGAKGGVEGSFEAEKGSFEECCGKQIVNGSERSLDFVPPPWRGHFARDDKKQHLLFFISLSLFLLGATISIFTSTNLRAALGEWKAFYVEPVVLFFLLIATFRQDTRNKSDVSVGLSDARVRSPIYASDRTQASEIRDTIKDQYSIFNIQYSILFALILSGLATSILAISQHFTGWMVPWDFWENGNTYRVTGWWGFPNGVGLYIAPIVPLALGVLYQSWNKYREKETRYKIQDTKIYLFLVSCILFLILAPLAIFYAKSTGSIIGVAAGIGTLLLIYKKTRWPAIIIGTIGLVGIMAIPNFSGIRQELLLKDRSGQIRLSIWAETWEFLKDHPVRGAGLASYQERILPYHTQVNGENIEIFHHPHNLFLTMWVNTGLLGLIGFFCIVLSSITYHVSRIKKKETSFVQHAVFVALITILVTGLVDSPYIKNDWAMVFWAVVAMLIQPVECFNKKNEHVGS